MDIEPILEQIRSKLRKTDEPVFVAICGCADTSKTTLAKKIADGLLRTGITSDSFSTDSFMLDRGERNRLGISGYDPRSISMEKLLGIIEDLNAGQACRYYPYDNRTGKNAGESKWIQASQVYIIEGIHAFHADIRKRASLNIYLDADNSTLEEMRFHANIRKRGFNEAEARARIASEMKDFIQYTLPGSRCADLRIRVDTQYHYEILI